MAVDCAGVDKMWKMRRKTGRVDGGARKSPRKFSRVYGRVNAFIILQIYLLPRKLNQRK